MHLDTLNAQNQAKWACASYWCICLMLYDFGKSYVIFVSSDDPPAFY